MNIKSLQRKPSLSTLLVPEKEEHQRNPKLEDKVRELEVALFMAQTKCEDTQAQLEKVLRTKTDNEHSHYQLNDKLQIAQQQVSELHKQIQH